MKSLVANLLKVWRFEIALVIVIVVEFYTIFRYSTVSLLSSFDVVQSIFYPCGRGKKPPKTILMSCTEPQAAIVASP